MCLCRLHILSELPHLQETCLHWSTLQNQCRLMSAFCEHSDNISPKTGSVRFYNYRGLRSIVALYIEWVQKYICDAKFMRRRYVKFERLVCYTWCYICESLPRINPQADGNFFNNLYSISRDFNIQTDTIDATTL